MSRSAAALAVALSVLAVPAPSASAREKIFQVDDATDGTVQAQGGFAAGESAAVGFVPEPGDHPVVVRRLQFLVVPMQSANEGKKAEFGVAVLDDPGTRVPGDVRWSDTAELTASTQGMNELALEPPVEVASGGFRVQLTFLASYQTAGMTIASDQGPIDTERNFLHVDGAWQYAANYGVTGNWVIRAVADVADPVDAGPSADAGADAGRDAGAADAGAPDAGADEGPAPAEPEGGCGCGAPGGALLLTALVPALRRRAARGGRGARSSGTAAPVPG